MRVDEAIYLLAGYGANINPSNPVAEAVKMGIEALEGLQPAQPERKTGEWIPISERLPEEEGSYLVTDDAGGVKTVQDDVFLHYEDGTPLWLYSQNVTAWQPLPEPYIGDKDDFNNKRLDS